MKKSILVAAVFAALSVGHVAAETETEALSAEGKAKIQAFAGALKGELQAAMQKGGPVEAIAVCNVEAPEIAAAVSTGDWTVGRSSHRLRNQENAPDEYTEAAIEDFLARQADGEPAAELIRTDIVEEDGKRVFRMVKAIPTGKLCLTCHGTDLAPEVAEKLSELYPEDEARGFREGEMRGAFTLRKRLD